MGNGLPEAASTAAGQIDFLFWLIMVITGIAFVVVEVALLWFLVKYRRRDGRKALYTHGNTKAEIIWTAIPAITVVIIGILSAGTWANLKQADRIPAGALEVAVHAQQFEWMITYPGADGSLGTGDDFTIRNQLHIPVDRPVRVMLTAEDAIHSFFVPVFRLKQDAVPGMSIPLWFEATKTGAFEIACAELCGLGHYRMRGMVTVHTQDDYDAWLASQTGGVTE